LLFMRCKATVFILIFVLSGIVIGQTEQRQKVDVVTFWARQQFDEVAPAANSAIAIHFELEDGWHFYASADTAPGAMNIKFEPNERLLKIFSFSEPIFPKTSWLYDEALGKKIEVIGGKFTIYLPFKVAADAPQPQTLSVDIGIVGAVCSQQQCRVPNFGSVITKVKITKDANDLNPKFALPAIISQKVSTGGLTSSVWAALVLAFVAGLTLNIMPCVWPVLPIIIMRLVGQAESFDKAQGRQGKRKSIVMGLAFCAGILLFFACLSGANIILKVFFNQVLQWGDQLRNPSFIIAMVVLLVGLALFMFGLFTISVPSSLGAKGGSSGGLTGAVGTGFLAAILSTPCSFGILAAAFAWAQAQPLALATLGIMTIGVGMAAPYAILTSIPALLKKTPKPGRWMELFKQTIGFVLLVIAVKLIAAVPGERRTDVLYFTIAFAFCVWMWGGWVGFTTPAFRKWTVRIIAVALAVVAGFAFLPAPKPSLIDWKPYDAAVIKQAQDAARPVLIDFTADWCLSCAVADKNVYGRKDIADLIKQKNVLAIKADTTLKDYPATKALKEIYNEPGVPVSILLVPGQEPMRWRGIAFGDELKEKLEKL
jgi:thiol:disulfide interchange protein